MILAGLGVPLALVESLPYMMVGMFSPRDTHGQLLGKLNVWIGESYGARARSLASSRVSAGMCVAAMVSSLSLCLR